MTVGERSGVFVTEHACASARTAIPGEEGDILFRGLGALLLAGIASHSQATTEIADGAIARTLVADGGRFGGCMAHLDVDLQAGLGLDCASNWVTFSCTGVHTDTASAQRLFDSALVAFVTNRRVRVWVTDEKKHNGHCYASRIDLLPTQVFAD